MSDRLPASRGKRRALPALHVALAASRRLAWALGALHGLAVTVALFVSMPLPARGVLAVAVGVCGILSIRRHALLVDAASCMALRLREPGRCEVLRRDGTRIAAQIHGGSYVLPGLVILRLRLDLARRSAFVILMPDAVAPDAMRRLRVRLRWAEGAPDSKLARDLSL